MSAAVGSQRAVLAGLLLTTTIASAGSATAAPVVVPTAQASRACVAARGRLPNWSVKAPAGCTTEWRRLGELGERSLFVGRYAWPNPTRRAAPRPVATLVLYEVAAGSASATALWARRLDGIDEYFDGVSLARVNHRPVVRVSTCLEGTGGCADTLYLWKPGRLVEADGNLRADVERQLPAGYELRAAPAADADLARLHGGAWLKDDPQCCPSAALECRLQLDGDRLGARDCTVAPAPAPAPGR